MYSDVCNIYCEKWKFVTMNVCSPFYAKDIRSPLSAEVLKHWVLSGGTKLHALRRYQSVDYPQPSPACITAPKWLYIKIIHWNNDDDTLK